MRSRNERAHDLMKSLGRSVVAIIFSSFMMGWMLASVEADGTITMEAGKLVGYLFVVFAMGAMCSFSLVNVYRLQCQVRELVGEVP